MDRRTKFILLMAGSLLLVAAVGWFIVWPTLRPLIPTDRTPQPPNLPEAYTPPIPQIGGTPDVSTPPEQGSGAGGGGDVVAFSPSSPDAAVIAELTQRGSVLAERIESGASSDGFANLSDAQLGVGEALATYLQSRQAALRQQYPATGALYVTTARRLTAKGQSDVIAGTTFAVSVQLHVTVQDMAKPEQERQTVTYRQGTVTFTDTDAGWVATRYTAEAFTP
jgi:hypothetical protein